MNEVSCELVEPSVHSMGVVTGSTGQQRSRLTNIASALHETTGYKAVTQNVSPNIEQHSNKRPSISLDTVIK